MIGHYRIAAADVAWSPADDAKESGIVGFAEITSGTRVSVTVGLEGNEEKVVTRENRSIVASSLTRAE